MMTRMQVMQNAQESEHVAQRARQLGHELQEAHEQHDATQGELRSERKGAADLRRELSALASASQRHLRQFEELQAALAATQQVRRAIDVQV